MLRNFKSRLKTLPVIGPLAKQFYFRFLAPPLVSSADYWETRYKAAGDSGAGSHDRLARFKAEVLNDFVRNNAVGSVVEFGCGDGSQLSLANYPNYVGIDVSPTAVEQCRARFAGDPAKQFLRTADQLDRTFDLALSLDVIYHLVEDDVFEAYMNAVFDASHKWVIIYSSNTDEPTPEPHVRHRVFGDWITGHRPNWKLVQEIKNRYPYDSRNPEFTSFADFFVYQRRDDAWTMTSGEASELGHSIKSPLKAGRLNEYTAPVTVIMPAYGPGPYLDRVVAALQRQSPPIERIILSHSGPGDPTARFADAQGVTVLHSPERLFAGAARNRAMALAATDWVAFVDEDIIVDDGWHAALLEAIARGEADCIAGSIGYAETGGYWGMSLWFAEFGPVHPYRASRPIASGASANLAVRRELLRSIGGFREDWPTGEDSLAQANLEVAGYRIRLEPEMAGRHFNLPGLQRMLRHAHRLGRYSARQRRMHPHLTGAAAARWPVLSLGMWLARLVQISIRVLAARGPVMSLIWHTPGILVSVLAWNAGFTKEAFRPQEGEPDHKHQVT